MPYKNPTELLVDAAKLPAAIEAKLPAGAPKLSVTLVDIATKLPKVPDFPMELPDLPAPPKLPELPAPPGAPELRRYVTEVEAAPTPARPPAPALARTRQGIVPFVYE